MSQVAFHNLQFLYKNSEVNIYDNNKIIAIKFTDAMTKTHSMISSLIDAIIMKKNEFADKKQRIDNANLTELYMIQARIEVVEEISKSAKTITEAFERGMRELKPRFNSTQREEIYEELEGFAATIAKQKIKTIDEQYKMLSEQYEKIQIWQLEFQTDFEKLKETVQELGKSFIA